MYKKYNKKKDRRYRQLTGPALGVAVASACQLLHAQTEPATVEPLSESQEQSVEEVVVTGSRIAVTKSIDAPSPITSVNQDQLAEIGVVSTEDIFRRVPALRLSSTVGDTDRFTGFPSAAANLRDLGSDRTLVLINGRRHVSGVQGSAAVDVNSIPAALIERIEVVTGGSASIYGADAVSGVVNYILKKDYQGFAIDGLVGQSDRGLGREYRANALAGINFGDNDRGNVTVSLDWTRAEEVSAIDTGIGVDQRYNLFESPALYIQPEDITPALSALGVRPGDYVPGLDPDVFAALPASRRAAAEDPRFLAYTQGTKFFYTARGGSYGIDLDGDQAIDAPNFDLDGNGIDDCENTYFFYSGLESGCWRTDPMTNQIRPLRNAEIFVSPENGVGGDTDDFPDSQTILAPAYERYGININTTYDFADNLAGFLEAKFLQGKASVGSTSYSYANQLPVALDNAFVPQTLSQALSSYANQTGDDLSAAQWVVARDNFDWLPDRSDSRSQTTRLVAGVEGQFARGWKYELAVNWGRTEQTRRSISMLTDRFYAALDAVIDPDTGRAVCRSSLDPTAIPPINGFGFLAFNVLENTFDYRYQTFSPDDGQCRPLNIFNAFQPQDAEALAFVSEQLFARAELEQRVVSAQLTGDLGERWRLDAGPVRFALGAEYRRESSDTTASEEYLRGFSFDSAFSPTRGAYDSRDVFFELQMPLLADQPWAEELSVQGSARYSRFSTAGSVNTWGLGLVWSPVRDIRLRSSLAKAVRAPNINELFAATTFGGYDNIDDPCEVNLIDQGLNPENRRRNCALDGIPEGYAPTVGGGFTRSGGNTNLEPETGNTFTTGIVLQPRMLPSFTATIDYYRIEIENAINTPDLGTIIEACYDASDFPNQFCGQFSRNRDLRDGDFFLTINRVEVEALNFARFETSGVDVSLNFVQDLAAIKLPGQLDLNLNFNRILKLNDFLLPNDPASVDDRIAGRDNWTVLTNIGWEWSRLNIGVNSTYLDRSLGQNPLIFAQINPEFGPTGAQKPIWLHDLSVQYEVSDNMVVQVGANNITGVPSDYDTSFFPRAYPRRYFLNVAAKF
jgi:iron complex outermembrane recepter protein